MIRVSSSQAAGSMISTTGMPICIQVKKSTVMLWVVCK